MLLLGSATPDVGSYFSASQSGRILELPQRVFKQAMPEVKMVDMRHEFSVGNRSIFSNLLANNLEHCLAEKEQSILLINRRGYASHVFCRACGHVPICKNCSVALVYHQPSEESSRKGRFGAKEKITQAYLACHHCGFR